MPGIPSKDASFVWGTPRNYALTKKDVFHTLSLLLKTRHEVETVAFRKFPNDDPLIVQQQLDLFFMRKQEGKK